MNIVLTLIAIAVLAAGPALAECPAPEAMEELYPRLMAPSTDWQVIREYFCPLSGDLLDVEAPTPWYPVIHDFEPDIDTFYGEWLDKDLPARA